ncbi:MAG: helix-turn-helix transcriptional regulator [Leptospirales bacterium]|nr:helix-turn-helix transcriptional regulator [Leptospirales bacterium]
MAIYNAGELIKTLRKQKGVSQEDLADGITDRANLSKIENGSITPGKKIVEALLEKLGFSSQGNLTDLTVYLDGEMSDVHVRLDELDAYLKNKRTGEADALISVLENDKNFQKGLYLQHLLAAKAANSINKNEDTSKIRALLDESIKISIPAFNERYIADYMLTRDDLRIINMMAIVHLNTGEIEKAIKVMYGIKDNFDKNCIDKLLKGIHYPMVIYNLTTYLIRAKRHKEAANLCDAGLQCCLNTDFFRFMPLIIGNKVRCLFEMGDIESCERLVRQAYHGFDMFEMYDDKAKVKKYAKEKLGIDL